MEFQTLRAFRGLFEGVKYEHRRSHLGDHVASFLYEDLLELARSPKLVERINTARSVMNTANVAVGRQARRGDGTFGEAVPGVATIVVEPYRVARGRVASVEVGAETKILAKAMMKQIDRVSNDLRTQVDHFRSSNPRAICIALVGVNHAESYVSYEGSRKFATDGRRYKHPVDEALEAERRLRDHAAAAFDEFVILSFRASNRKPFEFSWLNEPELKAEFGAALARVSREYESRF